jgi:hypothetical protein
VANDLKDQIHLLMERGIRPVSADDIASAHSASTTTFPSAVRLWLSPVRAIPIAAGVAAAGCAAVLVAGQLGGAASSPRAVGPRHQVVLTAATLRHVTRASRLALAKSGQALVFSRQLLGGVLQQTGRADITFSGRNWNDSFTVVSPAVDGAPASSESAINRVVAGQAYDYFVARDGLAWYHDTGPHAVADLSIPDPRLLLRELAPAARFVESGHSVLGGVTVTRLKATNLRGLPTLNSPQIWPAGRITALSVWVDPAGVVRQLTVSAALVVRVAGFGGAGPVKVAVIRLRLRQFLAAVSRLEHVDHLSPARALAREKSTALGRELARPRRQAVRTEVSATTITIRFTGIGKPEIITAPAHAILTYGLG